MSICSPKITVAVGSFKFKTVLPRYNTGAFIVKAAAAFPEQLLVFLRFTQQLRLPGLTYLFYNLLNNTKVTVVWIRAHLRFILDLMEWLDFCLISDFCWNSRESLQTHIFILSGGLKLDYRLKWGNIFVFSHCLCWLSWSFVLQLNLKRNMKVRFFTSMLT